MHADTPSVSIVTVNSPPGRVQKAPPVCCLVIYECVTGALLLDDVGVTSNSIQGVCVNGDEVLLTVTDGEDTQRT